MDLQCPATIICLTPRDDVPPSVGGQRTVAGYLFELESGGMNATVPLRRAPAGKFWEVLPKIADQHRGEGVVLFASREALESRGLRGAMFSVDSSGPLRIDPDEPVENP